MKKDKEKEDKKETTAVAAKAEETALATKPNMAAMMAADSGAGMEGATIESFAIPFLMILQKGSPQVDEASGNAIEGAKAGMLFENISRQLVDGKEGVVIIPCAYRRVFLHWSEAKGFQGEISPEEVVKRRSEGKIVEFKGKLYVPNAAGTVDAEECDKVNDARNHYVLIVDRKTGAYRQALLSLGSTQIKKSRALMTALASIKVEAGGKLISPPTFANLVKVTTVPEANDKGTWFGWKFELDGIVDNPELYAAAKKFHAAVAKGEVEARYTEAAEAAAEGEEESKGF